MPKNKLPIVQSMLILIVILALSSVLGIIVYSLKIEILPRPIIQPIVEPKTEPAPTPKSVTPTIEWKRFASNGKNVYYTKDWNSYSLKSNHNISFSITYPAQWKFDNNNIFESADDKKIAEFMPGVVTLDLGQKCFDSQYERSERNELISQTNATIGKYQSILRIEKTIHEGGGSWYPNIYCVMEKNKAFIMAFYEDDLISNNKDLYEKIMSGLTFGDEFLVEIPNNTQNQSDWKTLINKNDGFSIKYPPKFWTENNNVVTNYKLLDESSAILEGTEPEGGVYVKMSKSSYPKEYPTNKEYEDYLKSADISKYLIDKVRDVEIGKYISLSDHVTGGPGGELTEYYAFSDKFIYTITISEPGYSEYKELIDEILATFILH